MMVSRRKLMSNTSAPPRWFRVIKTTNMLFYCTPVLLTLNEWKSSSATQATSSTLSTRLHEAMANFSASKTIETNFLPQVSPTPPVPTSASDLKLGSDHPSSVSHKGCIPRLHSCSFPSFKLYASSFPQTFRHF